MKLRYIGVMVNHRCTAACRHCLYASSPQWKNGYITEETGEAVCSLLAKNGLREIHIGGGEPFLDFSGLCDFIKTVNRYGIYIQYIETNGFWCYNRERAMEKLRALCQLNVNYLMVSCDPFHLEYVPLRRVLNFIEWCQDSGMGFFVWKERYLHRFLQLGIDIDRCYTREELEHLLGKDYIWQTASEYGLGMNGRALHILEEYGVKRPAHNWLSQSPCPALVRLADGHIDLASRLIPSDCVGLGFDLTTVMEGSIEERYPLYKILRREGLQGLYHMAEQQGFVPCSQGYPSACSLCFSLRSFLLKQGDYQELYPREFYENQRVFP